MVEAVGHADGGLDPVVGRLEPGVGVSQPDRAQDAGPAPPDLLGEFDDLGYARVGRPEHPTVQFAAAWPMGCLSRVRRSSLGCHER